MSNNSYFPFIVTGLGAFLTGFYLKKITFENNKLKINTIKKPNLLIAFTDTHIYGEDVNVIVNSKLTNKITTLPNVTISKIRTTLSSQNFDIVHLGIPIGNSGNIEINGEQITTEALVGLFEISKTKLLILGSCNSVTLTANALNKLNMIAATNNLSSKDFEMWEDHFYGLLAKGYSLTHSFDLSKKLFPNLPLG